MVTADRSSTTFAAILGMLMLFSLCGCIPPKKTPSTTTLKVHNQKLLQAKTILAKGGKFADNSFYACLVDGLMQGLPSDQVSELCATQLVEDDGKGFGGPMGNLGNEDMFDPGKITAACSSGDPTHSQSSGYGYMGNHGEYSWGGDSRHFYQYSKEESEKLKNEAIAKADAEDQLFRELEAKADQAQKDLEDAKKTGDQNAIQQAEKKLKEATEKAINQAAKAEQANKDATADPNRKPPSVARGAEDSPCTQALDAARELLRECNRTGWKDFRCQQLNARMHGCPDPALILVDPEQGYSCGTSPDPEAVKDAWVKQCEQRVKYGPDGSNPCEPPKLEDLGRTGTGKVGDVCNDPKAYINPDNNDCMATLQVDTFGRVNVQEIIVYGLNKIGGPIFVLPSRNPPPPQPGPQPRPGPR